MFEFKFFKFYSLFKLHTLVYSSTLSFSNNASLFIISTNVLTFLYGFQGTKIALDIKLYLLFVYTFILGLITDTRVLIDSSC